MDAGKFNERVEFWQLNIVASANGNTSVPTLLLSTWCKISSDRTLSRVEQSGGIDLQGSIEIIIYQRTGFIPSKDLQIRYKGKKYIISSITDFKDDKDYWRLIASYEN